MQAGDVKNLKPLDAETIRVKRTDKLTTLIII